MAEFKISQDQAAPGRAPAALEVTSLVDALYQELRERILTGALPGGTPITELSLATQYSVARPTAKAAMERLVHEGLLRRGSHKTARVPVLSAADIRDLYLVRSVLERDVATALAERGLVPPRARDLMQQLLAIGADPPIPEVVSIDVDFHISLVDALGSPRTSRMYRSLVAEVRLCMAQVQARHLVSPGRIALEHAAILDRIEARDVEGAGVLVEQHLERACSRLLSGLEQAEAPGA